MKSISVSTVEDLKKAVVTIVLDETMEEVEVQPIQIPTLVNLGNDFYGIPPLELNHSTFQADKEV